MTLRTAGPGSLSHPGMPVSARRHDSDALVGGNQALPWDHRDSMPRTHAWEVRVGQDGVLVWKAAPRFPRPHLPVPHHGKSPAVSSARPKQEPVSRVSASH